jgi:hypothetical protein
MASFGIRLGVGAPDRLASELRQARHAVQGRVTDDAVLLDLRTVAEEELDSLAAAVGEAVTNSVTSLPDDAAGPGNNAE